MELDLVDPVAVAVVSAENGGILVRLAPELDRLATGELTDLAGALAGPAGVLALEGLDQRPVLLESVVAHEGRRLVQHLVGGRVPAGRLVDDRHRLQLYWGRLRRASV